MWLSNPNKFEPDRFSRFDVYFMQTGTHRQTNNKQEILYKKQIILQKKVRRKLFVKTSKQQREILTIERKLKEEAVKLPAVSELTSSVIHYSKKLKDEAVCLGSKG